MVYGFSRYLQNDTRTPLRFLYCVQKGERADNPKFRVTANGKLQIPQTDDPFPGCNTTGGVKLCPNRIKKVYSGSI